MVRMFWISLTITFLAATPAEAASPVLTVLKFHQSRWGKLQCLREPADIQQGNIALPTFHTAEIAPGQTALQRELLLRPALGFPKLRQMPAE